MGLAIGFAILMAIVRIGVPLALIVLVGRGICCLEDRWAEGY